MTARLDRRLIGAFSDEPPQPPLDANLPAGVFLAGVAGLQVGARSRPSSVRERPATSASPVQRSRRRRREDEEHLPRGTIIDKYCLDRVVGRGGFAVVYRATHLLLGSTVALKLVRPRVLARQPGLAALLCREARYAARINHPNVVGVHDVTHTDQITYIVMEYIEGRSLAETIHASGPLPAAELVRVGLAVTAGLRVGLAQGLIHRDIKPANILLASDGAVKIVDLGLAHASNLEGSPTGKPTVVGTYGYMSPEQALDPEKIDFRSDIYSLGVTLYEAATGSLPFSARDPARCLEMHRHHPVPPPQTRAPALPTRLSTLLLATLAKRPEDRPSSYDALESALRSALEAPAAATPVERPVQP